MFAYRLSGEWGKLLFNTSQAFALVHIYLEHNSCFHYADEVRLSLGVVGSFGVRGGVARVGCFDT